MIHVTETEADLSVQDALVQALQAGHQDSISVNALVDALVHHGLRRESALSCIHQELASGRVLLTEGFRVAPAR